MVGVTLELKPMVVVVTNLIRVNYCCIAITFALKIVTFTKLQEICRASVLKIGVVCMGVCVLRCMKEELAQATDKRLCITSNIMVFKNSYSTKELKETKE